MLCPLKKKKKKKKEKKNKERVWGQTNKSYACADGYTWLFCLSVNVYVYWKSDKTTLTPKTSRKPASENAVCLCRLLNILANFSNLFFAYRQTVWTLIRLLLEEQSDLGSHCLQKWHLKSQADDKTDDNCCDWQFKG